MSENFQPNRWTFLMPIRFNIFNAEQLIPCKILQKTWLFRLLIVLWRLEAGIIPLTLMTIDLKGHTKELKLYQREEPCNTYLHVIGTCWLYHMISVADVWERIFCNRKNCLFNQSTMTELIGNFNLWSNPVNDMWSTLILLITVKRKQHFEGNAVPTKLVRRTRDKRRSFLINNWVNVQVFLLSFGFSLKMLWIY